jgi:nucleoside-diphosphate-sugar epimerase
LVPIAKGGSVEADTPNPVGEYAMSCLGRERMFEHFSRTLQIPTAIVRLNYACELRYGVLVDLAQQIWAGKPINLSMSWFNTIWQTDANAMTLQCFDHVSAPPFLINVTGSETLNVREVCKKLSRLMDKPISFSGGESTIALLNDARRSFELFGKPRVPAEQLLEWVADWVKCGKGTLGKPTHFESRDGKF